MTEQEYINATDLEKVRTAKESLIKITTANSKIIDAYEHTMVLRWLAKWEEDLYEAIEIKRPQEAEL